MILAEELEITGNFQQLLVQMFLQQRLQLSEESNERLLYHLQQRVVNSSAQLTVQQSTTKTSKLEALPKDIFIYIGSLIYDS